MTGGEEGASTKQFADYRPQLELFAAKRLQSVVLASQEWDAVEASLPSCRARGRAYMAIW